jgi:hypothetical protein
VVAFEGRLERARRLAGLRLDALVMSVGGMGDSDGWSRLYALGTRAVLDAQDSAVGAVGDYLTGTAADAGLPERPVVVPLRSGFLQSGQPVARFIAATRDAVGARMTAGATFPDALAASATVVKAVGASEPHRIGRDGTLAAALDDPRFTRYRRVPEARACRFCLMLASRGAVYLTETTAGAGRKFHANCRCRIEAVAVVPDSGPRRARVAA